ncbi:hypothetical protein ACHAWX_000408 [Stephanocyclus meneghinianus]
MLKRLFQCLKKYIGHSSISLSNLVVLHCMREAKRNMKEFIVTALSCALDSTDATHIMMCKCVYNLCINHLGGKLKNTTHSYNKTVNHWNHILDSTQGGPGRWNDQTMGLFETFVKGIHDGEHLQEAEFKLLECQNGRVVLV